MPRGKQPPASKTLQASPLKPPEGRSKHVNQVLNLIPELNQQELKVVQIAVQDALLEYLEVDKELLNSMFEIVGEKPVNVSAWAHTEAGKRWRQNQGAVEELVNKLTKGVSLRKTSTLSLRKFLLDILIQDMKARYLPITLPNICSQLQFIESAFKRAFPGYIESNLQRMIIGSFL